VAESGLDVDAVRAALDAMVAEHGPGLVAVLSQNGTELYAGAHGSADVATGRAPDVHDRFRIGSITKPYVAAVTLQLAAEGALSLDDTLERFLPGLVPGLIPGGGDIGVRNLLRLRSGLPDYTMALVGNPPDPANLLRYWTPQQLVALALAQPERRPPDEAFRYSNTDYVLLGLIIEAATGERLDVQLWRRIFSPLGLRESDLPTVDPYLRGPHATGYLRLPGAAEAEFTMLSPSESWASGAIVSTPAEVVRFFDALCDGTLLDRHHLAAMLEMQPVDATRGYGYGLHCYTLPDGRQLHGHLGAVPGFTSATLRSTTGRTLVLYRNCLDLTGGELPIDSPLIRAAFTE
jgi:D-alanyl-D-alanine carboxypeptidase